MQSALATLRSSLLQHLRLPIGATAVAGYSVAAVLGRDLALLRRFSSDAHGAHLEKSEVTDRILSVVKRHQKVDPAKVSPTANFQNDLGLDSLDTVEIVMAIEEEFAIEIPDAEADKIMSLSDGIDYIAAHPLAK